MINPWKHTNNFVDNVISDMEINSVLLPGQIYKRYLSEDININSLIADYRGKSFGELIIYHHEKHKHYGFYHGAIQGIITMMPEGSEGFTMKFVDHWLKRTYDSDLWAMDASHALTLITNDAFELLRKESLPTDDETVFNMFQIVVLSYTYNVARTKETRKFIEKSTK